jgi:hypothetical protein
MALVLLSHRPVFTLGLSILRGLMELCSLPTRPSNSAAHDEDVACSQAGLLASSFSSSPSPDAPHRLVMSASASPYERLRQAIPTIFELQGIGADTLEEPDLQSAAFDLSADNAPNSSVSASTGTSTSTRMPSGKGDVLLKERQQEQDKQKQQKQHKHQPAGSTTHAGAQRVKAATSPQQEATLRWEFEWSRRWRELHFDRASVVAVMCCWCDAGRTRMRTAAGCLHVFATHLRTRNLAAGWRSVAIDV